MTGHDPIVHHRLNDGPKNAAYTSPDIQNTLLNVMGNIVRSEIFLAVKNAGVYRKLPKIRPPFCTLLLGKSGEGAFAQIFSSSCA